MGYLNTLAKNTRVATFTAPISMRGVQNFSLTSPLKLIFNLPTATNAPLVDLTDCRYGNIDLLHIENIGQPAGCGLLLARSAPTISSDFMTLSNVRISGAYQVAALLLVGSEMISVKNSDFFSNQTGASAVRVVATLRNPLDVAKPLVQSSFGPIGLNPDGTMASVSQSVVRFEACGASVEAGGNSDAIRIGQGCSSITWDGGCISMNVAGARSAFKIGEVGGTKCQYISIVGRPQIESPLDNGVRRLENYVYVDSVVEHLDLELGINSANKLITERSPGLIIP